MLSTPTPQSLTETPAVSSPRPARVARTHVLPVAEIYSVLNAERNAGEVIVACVVGDERNPAKRHGLRAPRSRWVQLVKALAAEDPALGDEIRAALAPESRAVITHQCSGCDYHGCPVCSKVSRPATT